MGHRRHSTPHRGSLAYLPKGRAKSMEARIRTWPKVDSDQPKLLAHAGFKAGCVQIVSIDDREKTPNHGKQLVSLGTIIVTPPVLVIGIRGYSKNLRGRHAEFDLYANNLPKNISRLFNPNETTTNNSEKSLDGIKEIFAIIAITPKSIGLQQKKPYVFEVPVTGGDIKEQFTFLNEQLGKNIKIDQVFEAGTAVDVAAITKGKGWEGPITRYGVKRKQHKSRKSVREVASLGPISPQYVMYTVPRAGQRGFHQRIEYNKRIMVMDNTENTKFKINPDGGFKHFGNVNGDFVIVRGSVPGTYNRLVKLRAQIRNAPLKKNKPNVLEVVI
ncbi:50S ribosomal protein L3 [Marine Group I thaumarchaeote SCGC AAA799-O18]|nr:50S ribosomal protein L3 [Marine Group I thaumarchaeote SCGC AAA799-O18]